MDHESECRVLGCSQRCFRRYASFPLTIALSMIIGFVMASAFSAIVVFAQSLMPDRIGMISGVFFGLLFGFGGLGAALLGMLADLTSMEFVYKVCSFFPLMGLLTALLPDTGKQVGES